jgi:hypothetical protein
MDRMVESITVRTAYPVSIVRPDGLPPAKYCNASVYYKECGDIIFDEEPYVGMTVLIPQRGREFGSESKKEYKVVCIDRTFNWPHVYCKRKYPFAPF